MIHQTVKQSSFLSIGAIFANLADQDKSENHSKELKKKRNKNTDLHQNIPSTIGSLKHNGLLRSTKEKGYYSSPAGDPAVRVLDAMHICHSGKLKVAFTSPDVISTSPKTFCSSVIQIPHKTSLARRAS